MFAVYSLRTHTHTLDALTCSKLRIGILWRKHLQEIHTARLNGKHDTKILHEALKQQTRKKHNAFKNLRIRITLYGRFNC